MGGWHLVDTQAAAPLVSAPGLARTACLRRCHLPIWRAGGGISNGSRCRWGRCCTESCSTPSHVCFPATARVALLYVMESGASAEIAVVGNEGLVGISVFMGGGSTPGRAVVQSAGHGFRMNAQAIKEEFERSAKVMQLLLRYTQALITQMAQIVW